MSELLKLAEECERVDFGSDDLDKRIADAVGFHWFPDEDGLLPSHLIFTRSLDAARALIPKGCDWALVSDGRALLWRKGGFDLLKADSSCAKSPAKALVAAALKARARAEGEE